ncbi:MAG TPA: CoB--CoM heterodisulfide reductase iron-sulfur subunit B family protein [Candidatus Deferrimicrobium sp.]|nr:CoB--CoM heterodisulfide reductase iron-sulfur subunit B family protein [Candidatus Deferrimicrobium sp.]
MSYLYYPGCSLKGTGKAYEESLLAVFQALELPVQELEDWNCCGATAYMAVDELRAFALAARNLSLAEQQNKDSGTKTVNLIAPCNACYLVLMKTQHYIAEYDEIRRKIDTALEAAQLRYDGRVVIRHPLDVLVNDVRLEEIATHVRSPLTGLRVACYYGCQIVRPYAAFDDQDNPSSMDRLLRVLGAEVVNWPFKTRCCGGSLTGTIREVGLRLNQIILKEARKRGADVIATACPLCQFNLECFQTDIKKQFGEDLSLPVLYFTQLLGKAFGLSEKSLGLQRLFVPLELAAIEQKGGARASV